MASSAVEIKVLTYNLWGIFNSRMREARMAVFAEKVANYDVILLQEQFSPEDFDLIIRSLPNHIRETRYFRRFPSGFYGSGSAVISRFPIRTAFFHTYPLQGYPEMVLHGDFFANKGCALVHLDVPVEEDGVLVNHDVLLYTTHLVAIYQKVSQLPSWKNERYLPYRISQAVSLADFIRATSKPTDEIIIGGDFNSSQRSLEVQIMLILLKRHGYRMRSVLPTPSAVLEHGALGHEQDAAHKLFTFSTENAFNASKTSYFKLLNMQSDIPSQIDHIFFNASAFSLQSFQDCPDAEPNFPFEIQVDEHTSLPSGVVVFTRNMVPVPPTTPWQETLANKVFALSSKVPNAAIQKQLQNLAAKLRPKISHPEGAAPARGAKGQPQQANKPSEQDDVALYPMSDHYGVAARLRFRNVVNAALSPIVDSLSADTLSEDERAVLNSVTHYLQDFVTKLRKQVMISRYMAVISVATLLLNVYVVRRACWVQEAHTAAAMRELCVLAEPKGQSSAVATAAEGEVERSATHKLKGALQSALSGLKAAMSTKQTTEGAPQAPQMGAAEFSYVAHQLSYRHLWATPGGSAAIATACGLTAFTSVAVGTFQRSGNANVLEEQVRLLRIV